MPRKGLLLTVGFENAHRFDQAEEEKLDELLSNAEVWGVAPQPLDSQSSLSFDQQEVLFRSLVKAAVDANKAIVVTSGQNASHQLAILKEEGADFSRVALVNNTLGVEQLQPWLDAGGYVVFDGFVTYAENQELRQAAKEVPLNRMLCASNQPAVTPCAIAQVPGGTEDVVWVVGEIVDLRLAYDRNAFMEVYDHLLANAKTVLGL